MPDTIYDKKDWTDKFINEESPDRFDTERLSRISAAIPEDARTVLDIGLGGGYIFKELKKRRGLTCFGIDISPELAKRLKGGNVCVADAAGIPFKDKEFDAVLAGDLIEHIKEEFFRRSVSEIIRVSRRYIVLNSPYKDAIDWPVAICGSCKRQFNVYGHMRRIDMDLIKKIFPDDKFDFIRIEILGRKRDPRPSILIHMARRWGKVYSREGSVCPHCFSNSIYQPSRNLFEKFTGKAIAGIFLLIDNLIPPVFKSGSEILVLIKKRS